MAKQTKRQRKFNASGGIKTRLEKGTITKHGKLRKRKNQKASSKSNNEQANNNKIRKLDSDEQRKSNDNHREDDFMGADNLAGLDLDTFFTKLSEHVEKSNENANDDEDNSRSDENSHSSDHDVSENESVDERESDSNDKERKNSDKNLEESDSSSRCSNGSDSEDDSDDDDIEAAEARMKSQLSKMKESDPDFHKFLKENEESLLEFGDQGDADEDIDDGNEAGGNNENVDNNLHLTPKVLTELSKISFESHSIKGMKMLLAAYKSACHLSDANGENEGLARGGEKKYIIESSKVFDELMVMCLNKCHEEFYHHLLDGTKAQHQEPPEDDERKAASQNEHDKPVNPKNLERATKWPQLKPLIISFFQSTLHLLSQAKDAELLAFVLKTLSKSLRFLTPLPRVAESLLKSLTSLWSAPIDSSEDYQVVRLNAFFRIRQLALTQPFPFIEDILKKTYLAYAKRAKFGSSSGISSSLPTLTFMGNCLVELYSLDYHSSYQHAFVYIRQLALLLRTAMQKKTQEAMQQVLCWQYFHCLKLWVAVLSSAAAAEDGAHMRSLIYPLTEIILGTVRFAPSPVRHMPSRFHGVRMLQQLAAASETFIPTTILLLDTLDWKEWYLSPNKSASRPARATRGLQLAYILKLPGKTDFLRTHEQLEAGINEFFLLLQREIELYRYSAGFPEFSIRIQVRLKQFAKTTRNARWRTYAKACLDVIERYSKEAVIARSKLAEAPKDVKRLECLLPFGGKAMQERHAESVTSEQKNVEANRPLSVSDKDKKRLRDDASEDDSEASDDDDSADSEEPTNKKQQQKKKKKKTNAVDQKKIIDKVEMTKKILSDDEFMKAADHVKEGVDWSDDEDSD